MKLLPSLKQKKRYIVFEIVSKQSFSALEVKTEVEKALLLFLGQLGVAKASPLFLKEKYKNNRFIVKVNNSYVDECKAALLLIKKIKDTPVMIKSLITSGTIKKANAYEVPK